jgi:mono/diheme cytochrome c family protein
MRTSLFVIISAAFLIRIIAREEKVSGQVDQLTGGQLYAKHCLSCHQEDGKGVHGMFPPLAGNAKITGPSTDIIRIVLFGLTGSITVNDRDYNQPMPPQGYLNDSQIADILNYVRNSWGNKAPPVTADDVLKTRKLGKVTN